MRAWMMAAIAVLAISTGAQAAPVSKEAKASVEAVLASYETIRGQLAKDELGVDQNAAALEKAATKARAKTPATLSAPLEHLAVAAGRLKAMPKEDADAVRKAFGEVSRSVVAVLVLEPSLRGGRQIFECPMAQGYQKWVQTTDKIANPYMGTRMLGCGTQSDWK